MGGEISKEVTGRVPWVLVISLSVIIGSLGTVWEQLLPAPLMAFGLGEIFQSFGLVTAPFALLIFTAVFSRLTGKRISMATLTYVFVIAFTCSWYGLTVQQPFEFFDIVASRHMNPTESLAYIPWFMAPPASVTSQLVSGKVPIPWLEWIPSILYHWTFSILVGLFMLAIATLFRRQWVDTEKLPFPVTLLAYELVRKFPEEKRSITEKLGKPFFLGILLGLAFQVPVFMAVLFPWFPDIFGWKSLCCVLWYVRPNSNYASIAGLTMINENPAVVAVGYIIPLSITFNVWFFYLIWLILMQVSYMMGYYTGIEGNGGCCRTGWASPSGVLDPPLMVNPVTYVGGLIGITVMTLVLNRRYLVETLKTAFGGHPSGIEGERNEAMTYRSTYLLLGSSFILLFIFFLVAGLSIASTLVLLITYFLYWVANARVYMMTGLVPAGDSHGGGLLRLLIWPQAPTPVTQDFALSVLYSRDGMADTYYIGGSILSGLSSFKMAGLTDVDNRGVLKATIAATVIAPLMMVVTIIWLCYTFGGTTLPGGVANGVSAQCTRFVAMYSGWNNVPVSSNNYSLFAPYAAVGFLVVVVLEFLRARFIWFPFNAIGFIIGMSRLNIKWGYWLGFLIAWVLKTITLRIGGSKLYDRIGVPIAAGFITGFTIALLCGGALGLVSYFAPF